MQQMRKSIWLGRVGSTQLRVAVLDGRVLRSYCRQNSERGRGRKQLCICVVSAAVLRPLHSGLPVADLASSNAHSLVRTGQKQPALLPRSDAVAAFQHFYSNCQLVKPSRREDVDAFGLRRGALDWAQGRCPSAVTSVATHRAHPFEAIQSADGRGSYAAATQISPRRAGMPPDVRCTAILQPVSRRVSSHQ